jgi:hypothetical protein
MMVIATLRAVSSWRMVCCPAGLLVVAGLLAGGCSSTQPVLYPENAEFLSTLPDVTDQRGRFREVFCAVLEERGETVPDYRPCEAALTRYGAESGGTGRPVDLGKSHRHLVAVVVPGVGFDCFSDWLGMKDTVVDHVRQFGYDMQIIDVESLSSSAANARMIRDSIVAMKGNGRNLVLIGYSKGAPDILEAVVAYPEIRGRIAAVVSAAGAVGGSPSADQATRSQLELLEHWPGADCSTHDGGALESLRPQTRKTFLEQNPLPTDFPYYSLVTCPERDRISSILQHGYKKLSEFDPRNDSQVLFPDEFIPGSSFIGCLNADHWALAVPIERSHPFIGKTAVDQNDYPREALVEALLRFVEDDLDARAGR